MGCRGCGAATPAIATRATGPPIGWTDLVIDVTPTTGTHDLYIYGVRESSTYGMLALDWFWLEYY